YCTPGQICSAAGLIAEGKAKTADEIRELMSGNICRCGAYPKIVEAIQEVHSGKESARTWRFVEEEELARVRKEIADETV
ncbi:MAG TPA: 2Fe-2S iron-sulfur cluster-binding protein, partial [Pyrinomonadaceae bacterium]|nr:2Fe-2S iron-sulfur cluster-binding protein [Pyrinomonadaceae bacterium]